jgi:hypothetical protein
MALRFAIQSGNWSTGSTWDSFAQLGFPNGDDDIYTNSYTVNMNQSVDVRSLNNSQTPRVVENIATPAMTSNATPSGFVYASSIAVGAEGWRAFDQNTGTFWQGTVNNTGTLTYEFPTARNIKRYAIRGPSVASSPRQWTLEGSNNNISFTILDTVTASFGAGVYTSGILANTSSFVFYRINITLAGGNPPAILDLELTESTGSGAGNLSGGTFNFNSGSISASVAAGINAGATNLITVTATTGTVNISAPFANIANTIAAAQVINHSGNCNLIMTASSFNGAAGNSVNLLSKTSTGNLSLAGNVVHTTSGLPNNVSTVLNITSTGNVTVTGNVIGALGTGGTNSSTSPAIYQTLGNLTIIGNVVGGLANPAGGYSGITFSGTTLTITGSITGASGTNPSPAINITSTPTINISGSINGASNVGILSATAITLNVTGSVNGSSAASGISLTGASVLNVTGPITAGSGAVGISSTSTSATNRLTGPFITGPTGIQPFYGPKLTIVTGSATFWTFTSPTVSINKTLYSTDLVSGVPSPSNVRQGVTYASGALVGTMIVPPTGAVAYGVPVDIYTGSAIIAGSNYNISNEIWNTPVTSLTGSSTIGARLSNSATIASTGAQIAALAGR